MDAIVRETRPMFDDPSHRYLPNALTTIEGRSITHSRVVGSVAHPAGAHPVGCPIKAEMVAIEATTAAGGVRWYGCTRAYINAELRLVVVGHNSRDPVRQQWRKVPANLQDGRE